MKRTKFNERKVRRCFPLLNWKVCTFCFKEFRRETGYRWPVWHTFLYSCGSCCASISHCGDMLDWQVEQQRALMWGEKPPAPPMRTFRNY